MQKIPSKREGGRTKERLYFGWGLVPFFCGRGISLAIASASQEHLYLECRELALIASLKQG
jgi:hypothetical protein